MARNIRAIEVSPSVISAVGGEDQAEARDDVRTGRGRIMRHHELTDTTDDSQKAGPRRFLLEHIYSGC